MKSFYRYGLCDKPVTPENICDLQPDGYQVLPDRVVPFNWMGDINPCGEDYAKLKNAIKENDGTAVGLFAEIAATPQKVEVSGVWLENMKAVEGLKVKIELYDMCGNMIEDIGFSNIDLGMAACCDNDGCDNGCGVATVGTFCRYNLDTSGSNGLIGQGDSAILRLTVIEEPVDGLLGDGDCGKLNLPMLQGGLIYKSYCNQRNLLSVDGKDFSCLDAPTKEITECWESSDRKKEVEFK